MFSNTAEKEYNASQRPVKTKRKGFSLASKAGVGGGLMAAAGAASAAVGDTITSAFASAQTNFGLAATGLITAVAVLTGIGLIVSLLRK